VRICGVQQIPSWQPIVAHGDIGQKANFPLCVHPHPHEALSSVVATPTRMRIARQKGVRVRVPPAHWPTPPMVVMARLGADRREQAKQSTDQNTRLEKLNAWLPTSGALYPHESRDPSECACANANAAPKLKFGPNYDLWTCSSGTRGLMVFRTSLCAATTIVRLPHNWNIADRPAQWALAVADNLWICTAGTSELAFDLFGSWFHKAVRIDGHKGSPLYAKHE